LEEALNGETNREWKCKTGTLRNEQAGGAIEHVVEYLVAAKSETMTHFNCEEDTEDSTTLDDIMDPPNSRYDDCFKYSQPEPLAESQTKHPPKDRRAAAIKHQLTVDNQAGEKTFPVFDITRAGPSLTNTHYQVGVHPFIIETNNGLLPRTGGSIRRIEVLKCYGYGRADIERLSKRTIWKRVLTRLISTIPGHSLPTLINTLQAAEQLARDASTEGDMRQSTEEDKQYLGLSNEGTARNKIRRAMMAAVMTRSSRPIPESRTGEIRDIEAGMQETNTNSIKQIPQPDTDNEDEQANDEPGEMDERIARHSQALTRVINRWTTIPIPSNEDWKAATAADPDTKYLYDALDNGRRLNYGKLNNKRYYKEWADGKLEAENGIVYQWEGPKATKLRQLRRKVVPSRLRQRIFVEYHATPLAGHVGIYKTYWRIVARFWWPGVHNYVKRMTTQCGHCVVANTTSHQAQQILHALSVDEPFDIIAMDIWHPGITTKMDSKPQWRRPRQPTRPSSPLSALRQVSQQHHIYDR
jgi:hypothetical protein